MPPLLSGGVSESLQYRDSSRKYLYDENKFKTGGFIMQITFKFQSVEEVLEVIKNLKTGERLTIMHSKYTNQIIGFLNKDGE